MKKSVVLLSGLLILASLSMTSCLTLNIFELDSEIKQFDRDVKMISNTVETVKAASQELTPEDEYYLGRSAAATIISSDSLYNNSAKVKYLNKICGALTIYSEKPYLYKGYKVAILNTYDINAISTPAGHIFISKGLLDAVQNEDELAAVIAHEIAHIQLNHSSEAIRTARTVNAVTTTMSTIDHFSNKDISDETEMFLGMSMGFVQVLIEKGFSSEQELEADKYALTLMYNAGYDPKAMANMLSILKDKQTGSTTFDKTHPSPKTRLDRVNKELKKQPFASSTSNPADRQKRFDSYK